MTKRVSHRKTKRRQKAAKPPPDQPVQRMIRASCANLEWPDEYRSLVPMTHDDERWKGAGLNASVGDLVLLGMASNSPADMAGGALAVIADQLDTLYYVMLSGQMPVNQVGVVVWRIAAHAKAAKLLAHRMMDERAPKKSEASR